MPPDSTAVQGRTCTAQGRTYRKFRRSGCYSQLFTPRINTAEMLCFLLFVSMRATTPHHVISTMCDTVPKTRTPPSQQSAEVLMPSPEATGYIGNVNRLRILKGNLRTQPTGRTPLF